MERAILMKISKNLVRNKSENNFIGPKYIEIPSIMSNCKV